MSSARTLWACAALVAALASATVLAGEARGASSGSDAAPGAETSATGSGLRSFNSCARLRRYIDRQSSRRGSGFVLNSGGDSAQAGASPAPTSSPTNVQEPGVDEPDIVKTAGPDGELVLTVVRGDLRAVDVSGASPVKVGRLSLPTGPGRRPYVFVTELFAHGDRALVISGGWGRSGLHDGGWGEQTVITEVDISDPASMRAVRTKTLAGSYVSSRLTGSSARVVISSYPSRANPVPEMVLRDGVAGERTAGNAVPCKSVHRPRRFPGLGMVSVVTIDLDHGLPAADADALISGGQTVYASPTSLYVATERWLAPRVLRRRVPSVRTQIHRFDADDPGTTEYASTGHVRGFMLNQWSMSEHDEVLRVASTTVPSWAGGGGRATRGIVTTLAEDGDHLDRIGRIGGLGKGETIHAVRFQGELGLVVTFRQVDPLYTLDLSDPADPKLLGELKIPGYSAYLHPIGDEHLLGIGRHATAGGRLRGARASMFDISDLGSPQRVGVHQLGSRWSRSAIEHDHRGLLYDEDRDLAALPVTDRGGSHPFRGIVALRVTPGGIERIGRIAHAPRNRTAVVRALVAGDRLYAISRGGISAHDPDTLERLAWKPFR